MSSRLPGWLAAQERALARRPDLEEALLGGRFAVYAWYRLRAFFAVRALAALAHLVELILLVLYLPRGWLTAGVIAVNLCQLAAAFWWGALETMRARLRDLPSKAGRAAEIARWLARAGVAVAFALALLALGLAAAGARGPGSVYVALCVLRLAADLLLRTIYSAVYASRRVYRPMVSLVAAEVLSLALVAGTASRLGAWSIPLSVAVSTLFSRGLSAVYTLRAYRELRLPWQRVRLRLAFAPARAPGRFLLAGLGNVATRLAPAAVLLLLITGEPRVALTFHVLAPLLAAAGLWPQVFYLDVVRLSAHAAGALRRRLERALALLALPVGALAWGAGIGLAAAGLVPPSSRLAAALVPVFLAQSLLGVLQVTSFARGRFAAMAASGVALAIALLVLGPTGGLVAAAVVLQLGALLARRAPPPRPESLADWTAALPPGAQVCAATLAGAAPRQARALAEALAARLGDPAAVVASGARVFFVAGAIGPAEIAALSGGLVSGLELVPAAAAPPGPPDVRAEFRARFPTGILLDVGRPARGGLAPRERAEAWRQAMEAAAGRRRRGGSAYDVTALRVGGEITALFLVPRDVPLAERAAWRRALG